jgi:hypothetical protein
MTASPEAPWSSVKQSVISRKLADGAISFCAHDFRCAQARTGVRRAQAEYRGESLAKLIGAKAPDNRRGASPMNRGEG